jgi:hypothetical protein
MLLQERGDAVFKKTHHRPFAKKRTTVPDSLPVDTFILRDPIVMNTINFSLGSAGIIEVVQRPGYDRRKKAQVPLSSDDAAAAMAVTI